MNGRILLAEDHQNLAQLLATFLKNSGYDVVVAENGHDLLKLIPGGAFDLLILDLNLPGISGVEILQKLRKSPKFSSLPVIIITGVFRGEKYSTAALKLGVRHYLEKPFSKEQFSAAVADIFSEIGTKQQQPSLLTTLLDIYACRKSGILKIDNLSPIDFLKGEPSSFHGENRGDFPNFLLSRGKIAAEDRQKYLESGEGRLFFNESGMLTFDELQNESHSFVTKMLMENLGRNEGIVFTTAPPDAEPPLLHISTPRLLYEASKLFPQQFNTESFIAVNATRFPARTSRFYRLANIFAMREHDIQVLEQINGSRSVTDLLQITGNKHDTALFLNFLHLLGMISMLPAPGAEALPGFFQKSLFNRPLDDVTVGEETLIGFDDIVEEVAENVLMAMGSSGMAAPLSAEEISFEQAVQREFSLIKNKNYYAIFGMTPAKFSFNSLKDAYFAKVREYSPERFMELSGTTSDMAQEILSIYAEAYNTLSNVVAKERYDEMLNDNKTMGIDGKQDGELHARIQFQSGQVFLDMGEFENAEKALQDAYTLEPDHAGHAAFLAWAIYCNSANKGSKAAMERARSLLAKSLQIEKSAEAFAFRGWMLFDEGRDGLAEGEFSKALKLNPKEPNAAKGMKLIQDKKESEKKGVIRRFFS